ncbi:MAG: hypothetical protein QOF48_176 [Verrucomicrobiota bacterium]|jgi:hypothetical protein
MRHAELGQPAAVGLVAVRAFRRELNIVPSTHWRWERKGWIGESINVGGRKYHTARQIAEFRRRAEAGEFAVNIRPDAKGGEL